MRDEAAGHFPDRVEIELHDDPENLARSIGFSIPLYRNGKSVWRQASDRAGAVDVAAIAAGGASGPALKERIRAARIAALDAAAGA